MLKIRIILLSILLLQLSIGFSSNLKFKYYLYNDSTKSRFNFKTGKKENGIYFHYGKIFDFKHEKNNLKKGYYVVTESFFDFELLNQEIIRYFNFGFPDVDFFTQKSINTYFLTVYFTELRNEAINKVIETKSAGVPHVWIQVLED